MEEIKIAEPSYYAIIPANVRYDKDLTPNAKLLYGEITALCNSKGYCWANNEYFANLYDVSKTSISKWISSLIEKKYVESKLLYKEGTKEILNRYLTLVVNPIEEKLNTPMKVSLNSPIEEKLKDNTTVSNITNSNNTINSKDEIIAQKQNAFAETLKPYLSLYGKDMLNNFFLYWTEPTKSGNKLRFDLQKTWDVARRLRTWNNNNFGNNSKSDTKVPVQTTIPLGGR